MRWIKRGLAAIAGLILLAFVVVYGGSEWVFRTSYAVAAPPIVADKTPAGVAEGARLASALGCRSCHKPDGTGQVMVDVPGVIKVATPAFAPVVASYSDAEMARFIRHGVKKDGTAAFIMPVEGHAGLADEDLARIIGWMRTLKPSDKDSKEKMSFGPMGRFMVLTGGLLPEVREVARGKAKRDADPGVYFTDTVCAGCHSMREARPAHDDGRRVPPLLEVGPAYDLAAFRKLLKTGVGLTPRDLGLMAKVAKGDLSHLTDAEVEAIHNHLKAEAAK
jgi:cytochrome c553